MRTILFILVMTMASLCHSDGNSLLEDCQALLDISAGNADKDKAIGAGFCGGYMQGVSDLNNYYVVALKDKSEIFFCIPTEVSNGQRARVVIKYLKEHPNLLHEHESGLVWRAFREAFPCTN